MALLINWLAAIGALVVFGLFYNNALLHNPEQAIYISLTALVFVVLSYVMRVNSVKLIHLNKAAALAGLVVVMAVIGAGIYFVVPQVPQLTSTLQYAVFGWLLVLDFLILGESLLTFKNRRHPQLEDRVHQLEAQEHRKAS